MNEILRAYQGESTCIIEGLAASAASFFALTADKVVIGDSALMMIHNPYSFSGGTAEDLRKTADFLDKVKSTIVNQYVRKTGKDEGTISDLMDAETWFTAKEAVENGFCDSIVAMEPVAACIDPEQAKRFKNAPKDLLDTPVVVDGNGAGETNPTIPASNNGGKAVSGADKVETGAVAKPVCVQPRSPLTLPRAMQRISTATPSTRLRARTSLLTSSLPKPSTTRTRFVRAAVSRWLTPTLETRPSSSPRTSASSCLAHVTSSRA